MSAIVAITNKRSRKTPIEPEDDAEADARVKAFLARMVRPGGPPLPELVNRHPELDPFRH
jgi:hypothetical protein